MCDYVEYLEGAQTTLKWKPSNRVQAFDMIVSGLVVSISSFYFVNTYESELGMVKMRVTQILHFLETKNSAFPVTHNH